MQLVGGGLVIGGIVQGHGELTFDGPGGVHVSIVPSAPDAEAGLSLRGTF